MGLFSFIGALGDTYDERNKLREGMNKPIENFDKEADKFLDNTDRLDQLETDRGFYGAVGDRMLGNAKAKFGINDQGNFSYDTLKEARKDSPIPTAGQPIPIPKAGSLVQMGQPQAAMPQGVGMQANQFGNPQVGSSPAMQNIMAAQQQGQIYGAPQQYGGGGIMSMLNAPSPMGALNVPQGQESMQDKIRKMVMGGR